MTDAPTKQDPAIEMGKKHIRQLTAMRKILQHMVAELATVGFASDLSLESKGMRDLRRLGKLYQAVDTSIAGILSDAEPNKPVTESVDDVETSPEKTDAAACTSETNVH